MRYNPYGLTREDRDAYSSNPNVLYEIKDLKFISGIKMITTNQLAEFYETSANTIHSCYNTHRKEFSGGDVIKFKPGDSEYSHLMDLDRLDPGRYSLGLDDGSAICVTAGYNLLFKPSAILRFGLLLTDSPIAEMVREKLIGKRHIKEETDLGMVAAESVMLFKSSEFGSVRVLDRDGEPWFVAADVCKALEVGNPTQALSRLDDDEKFTTLILNEGAASGRSSMAFVNEPGMYALVMGSRKPEARAFRRWITHDVIPSIRKHGAYMTPDTLSNFIKDPDFGISLLNALKDEQEKSKVLTIENQMLSAANLEWADRNVLNAIVRKYGHIAKNDIFAYAWTEFKKELLYKHGINLNSRMTKYRNDTGKKTAPLMLEMLADDELPDAISTAVSMCKRSGVCINDIITRMHDSKVS